MLLALILVPAPLHAQTSTLPPLDDHTLLIPMFTTGGASAGADDTPSDDTPAGTPSIANQVVRVYFDDEDDLAYLAENYDVWEEAVSRQEYVTVRVSQADLNAITQEGYEVEVDQALTASLAAPAPLFGHFNIFEDAAEGASINAIPGFACYRTVEETYMSMAQLAVANPTLATWTDVGDSYDKITPGGSAGYDINLLKLTNSSIPGPKPKLMIISAIHAREYTTAEMNTRFAEYLVTNYGVNPDVTWLLDYHEIHIMPQANPDGRKIAEGGQLWRKNTNPTNGCAGGDYGVDLNRNSSFQWGGSGSSNNSCSQTYRGPSPASEPEVQTIQSYASSIFTDQRGPGINDPAPADTEGVFITIHSYSELVLYPWGWTNNPAPNNDELATLGRKFGYFNGYEICNDCLYIADGVTDDYTYGELGVASYTFELGTSFFQDCATFENQIYPDNLPALLYAAKAARLPYQTPSGPDAINLTFAEPIVAAGTPAILTATIDDTRSNSNGQGTEPTQNIQAARYSIDLPSWEGGTTTLMSAFDGTFNSTVEGVTASIDTTGLSNGLHTIFVEGQDAAGNWGATTAVFLEIGTPPTTIFFDNFEGGSSWTTNPNGTDTATTGQWEVGNPEDTNSNGLKQLGTTVSGSNDLVTARLAGASVGVNDIDNGETSVRSPDIAIPASGNTTLSFSYYMAHTSNSSADDYLRVKVVGASTQTVLEELGAANDDDGIWASFSANLNSFAGQTIYLLMEAADAGNGSIVEAALDDVRITSTGTPSNQAPTADAGADQTVVDTDENGAENVTLDGSGSSDSDGTIASYNWASDSGVTIPDGVSPTASFPVGVHNVTLTVIDDEGDSDTDVVVITVNVPAANQPPTANAGANQAVTDTDENGAENVTLDGSGSSDPDGTITNYSWTSDTGVNIPDGVAPTASFSVGVHNVTLTVTDDDGATDDDTVVITVNAAPPNQAPSANAGVNQTVTDSDDSGAETVTLDGSGSSDSDGTINSYTWTSDTGVNIPDGVAPTASFSVGVHNVTLTVTDDDGATDTDVVVITVNAAPSGETIYVSSTTGGNVGGVSFSDEDILFKTSGAWTRLFDMSDLGVGTEINAFTLLDDGSALISYAAATTVGGISVDDSDIVLFVPSGSSTGNSTSGTVSLYFDGSTAGLTTNGEDIDAITLLPDDNENDFDLIISTIGSHNVPGVSGSDEDLLRYDLDSGTWTRYFDGSDLGLTSSTEDIYGVWIDENTGEIYFTTRGTTSASGVTGDGSDIYVCAPSSLGNNTSCASLSIYWDGSAEGYGSEVMDALYISR
ncbi:MAG: M14 family zinc carboxypeptidase [Chloroflexota bacterium]